MAGEMVLLNERTQKMWSSIRKGENTMKSTLIRILGIMILATSISAFALPESKAKKTNCDNTASESTTAPDSKVDQSDNSQEKSRRERLIEEQDKQWLHDVQNLIAG